MAYPYISNVPDDEEDSARKAEMAAFKTALAGEDFQRYVWRQIQNGFVFDTTFTAEGNRIFLNEGIRQSALEVFRKVLAVDPHIFAKMYIKFGRG